MNLLYKNQNLLTGFLFKPSEILFQLLTQKIVDVGVCNRDHKDYHHDRHRVQVIGARVRRLR